MDHKTPSTYIIKNFQEPHENFAAHKVWGIGEGKSFSFSKYFLPPFHARIALLAETESGLVFCEDKEVRFRELREESFVLVFPARGQEIALGKTRISFGFVGRLINP